LDVDDLNDYDMYVAGDWINTGTFMAREGRVYFDGTSAGKTIRSGGNTFYDLVFNGSGGVWTLQDALDVDNDLTITRGTLIAAAQNVNIGGNFSNAGTFTTSGTVTFDAPDAGHTLRSGNASFYDLVFDGIGGGWTLLDNLDVNRDLTITNGTLNASNKTIYIARDFTVGAGGTFTAGTSTVVFDNAGYVSHIHGTTFWNFYCTTPNKQLLFDAGATEVIQNTLYLNGGSKSTPIVLDINAPGARFTFDVQGGQQNVYYVQVSNSEADSFDIIAYNSIDGGNTDRNEPSPHWVFEEIQSPPPPPPPDPELKNTSIFYEEAEKLKKRYPKGKYRTTVIVYEGKVIVCPYDERGIRYEEGVILTGGQKATFEGEVK